MCAIFPMLRVRKLTGKPAFLTIADSESETPRIHLTDDENGLSPYAAESNTFRIQSDLLSFARRIAASIWAISALVNRAETNSDFSFSVPIFGLPITFFILFVTQKC